MCINNKYLFLLFAVAISITSCDKNFLDRDPLKDPSSATFWTSEADLKAGQAGVYGRLQADFFGYQRVYLDGLSDNAYADPTNSFLPNISLLTTGGINSSLGNSSPLGLMYSTPYRIIAACNYFLDNVDKAPVSDASKNVYKGEMRFIRALAYFDLVQSFGGVIIYEHFPTTIEGAKIAKSTKEQVYAFIEQDLDFAINHLPPTKYNGRAVKASAQALKGRVLIAEKKWSEAIPFLQAVISSGLYGLSPDYAAIFKTLGQANANINKEILFSTQYLAPNNVQRNLNGMDLELGNYALMQPYKDLADDYEMKDGKFANESNLYNPANPYANRDQRLDLTMKLPGEIWRNPSGVAFTPANATNTGFMMEKYVDLSRAPFAPSTTSTQTDQDYIHLRYADVLLMYAEAKNEVSGPDASIYNALNEVRARVSMPAVDQLKYNTQALLRDYIRHERRIELALEGHRYNDLKRWNIAHIKLPTLKTPAGTPLVFEERYYTLPFLQYELDNNPQLEQNPDYK
jgi:hypothetical protein